MTNQPTLDDLLCKLTTGYTREQLLSYPEEDTGLDEFEVKGELADIDKAKQSLQAYIANEVREAELRMADNLIDQERKLYKIFSDDDKICVGVKEMADEVREYYDGGIYAKN